MIIKIYLRKTIMLLTNAYKYVKSLDKGYIRIEEINVNTKEVVLYSPGLRTILKLSISEVIEDPNILSRLLPIQACWLGYYSSLSLEQSESFLGACTGLQLRSQKGRFRIASLNRKGSISYLDTTTNQTHTSSPFLLAQDPLVMNFFDPSQACYIGILAGADKIKRNNKRDYNTHLNNPGPKPLLYVIK